MKEYVKVNKKAYDLLAHEYNERDYEVKADFWYKIYDELSLKDKNISVLEIGPGHGRNIDIFKSYNSKFNITALELSDKMCEIIKNKHSDIKIINQDILGYDFECEKYDIIQMIAVIHLFTIEDAKLVLRKIRNLLNDDGYLIIGTTINDVDMEGFYEKEDYNTKVKRFRHKYTKESYEELLLSCGFEIYKSYFVSEKDRNKTWYDAVLQKVKK